jgi:hypothetical protein
MEGGLSIRANPGIPATNQAAREIKHSSAAIAAMTVVRLTVRLNMVNWIAFFFSIARFVGLAI